MPSQSPSISNDSSPVQTPNNDRRRSTSAMLLFRGHAVTASSGGEAGGVAETRCADAPVERSIAAVTARRCGNAPFDWQSGATGGGGAGGSGGGRIFD